MLKLIRGSGEDFGFQRSDQAMHDRDNNEVDANGNLDWTESADSQCHDSMTEPAGHERRPREFTLEETVGSVTPMQRPEDPKELSRLAKVERVARILTELARQSEV
jgi:hypothetical protein